MVSLSYRPIARRSILVLFFCSSGCYSKALIDPRRFSLPASARGTKGTQTIVVDGRTLAGGDRTLLSGNTTMMLHQRPAVSLGTSNAAMSNNSNVVCWKVLEPREGEFTEAHIFNETLGVNSPTIIEFGYSYDEPLRRGVDTVL